MTSQNRFWHAPARPTEHANPLPGLIELLLELLLHDVPEAHSAHLALDDNGPAWLVGDPGVGGRPVTARASLADGGTITLEVRADLIDDAPTQARLQRFIRPIVACLALERRLAEQADHAREAVAAIERLAVLDLATGVMMARRDCDPQTARGLVADWSAREGIDLRTLTPADVLERFTHS